MNNTAVPFRKKNALIKLYRLNSFIMVILVVLSNVVMSLSFTIFVRVVLEQDPLKNSIEFTSKKEEFLIGVIAAPLLETFVYQYLLISIVSYFSRKLFRKESKLLAIVVPALFFSLGHTYNIFYMINTFIGGMSLNSLYVITKVKSKYPFLYVALAHALYNLAALGLRSVG